MRLRENCFRKVGLKKENFLAARAERVRDFLAKTNADALLVTHPVNLLYLTGLHLSMGQLLIDREEARLFVDSRYIEEAEAKAPMEVQLWQPDLLLNQLSILSWIERLGFDSANTSHQNYLQLQKMVEEVEMRSGGERRCSLTPLDDPIGKIRMIKDVGEVDRLRRAGALGSRGYDLACTLLKEGITEEEIAREVEIFWLRNAAQGVAFDLIVAFGANSSRPHHTTGKTKLKKGMPVLMDIGVLLEDYHSDMTRVVFFGTPDKTMERVYTVVQEAQKAALDLCRPGIPLVDLDAAARGVIAAAGYEERFTHGLGHGVGLEIHEAPSLRKVSSGNTDRLQEEMVVTIEPGIYLPGIGGIRIEDTVAITATGHENLTQRSTDLLVL